MRYRRPPRRDRLRPGRANALGRGETDGNDRITLFVAFNYGGQAEIVDAATGFGGGTEDDFRRRLYAPRCTTPTC